MSERSAREVIEELTALFDQTAFQTVRDALDGHVSREEARRVLGPFQQFLEGAVHTDVVMDYTRVSANVMPDGPLVYEGWEGWLEHWRNWFTAWADREGGPREVIEVDREHVVVASRDRMRGRASGIWIENPQVGVFTVTDGRISRYDGYDSVDEAAAAARR